MKSDRDNSALSTDIRVKKLQTATAVFRAARVVFALGGAGFAVAAIVVAVVQAPDVGTPAAIGIALTGTFFGLALAAGMWFGVGWFLHKAKEHGIKMFGPQFEQDLTGRVDYWTERASKSTESGEFVPSLADIDWTVELTTSIAADGLEETLQFSAAMLFTKEDLRGNVELPVSAQNGFRPHLLTRVLLEHLKIGVADWQTRLSPVGHTNYDPDSHFSIWLSYSVTDLIGECDRPRLEQWIDEKRAETPEIRVYWDDRLLGSVRLVVTD